MHDSATMRHATRLLQPLLRSCLHTVWLEPLSFGLKSIRSDLLHQQVPPSLPRLHQSVYSSAGASVLARHAASSATDAEVETINRMFAECRDEIEMCREVGHPSGSVMALGIQIAHACLHELVTQSTSWFVGCLQLQCSGLLGWMHEWFALQVLPAQYSQDARPCLPAGRWYSVLQRKC